VAALPIDGVRRTADAESVEVASIPSFLQRTPGATTPLGPQAGHFEHARPAKGAAGSADLGAIGPVVDMPGGDPAAALLTARESLLAGIAYNFEVVDHALETALVEIEKLGGNLAGWLDDADTFACAAAVTGALLAGGAYYHRQTRGARAAGAPGEDAASWLITHACAAAGLS
jgi:hypothetical protein